MFRIFAKNADWSECEALSAASLTFKSSEEPAITDGVDALPEVLRLDLEASGALRAHLYAPLSAAADDYDATLRCNGQTQLRGVLRIRARSSQATLTITPSEIAAGSRGVELEFVVDGAVFVPGKTHVVFGDGSAVGVSSVRYSSGPNINTMWVQVDVSEVAPTPLDAPMPVSVVTASEVVRGHLAITNNGAARLIVSPATLDRPAQEDAAPLQYTLRVVGENFRFEAPDTDTETETDTTSQGTTVVFPDNPGLEVVSVNIPNTVLEATVLVKPAALTGSTRLVVTTGEAQVAARVTVRSGNEVPALAFTPTTVPWGAVRRLVWVRAVDFSLKNLESLKCDEAGCSVEKYEIVRTPGQDADDAFIWVTLNSAALSDNLSTVSIRAKTPELEVVGKLRLVAPSGLYLEATPLIVNRDSANPNLTLALHGQPGTKFSSNPLPTVSFPSRSGVTAGVIQLVVPGQQILIKEIKVAQDAPIGPVQLTVNSAGQMLQTILYVEPSGATGERVLRINESLVSRESSQTIVAVSGSTDLWGEQDPQFWFDDPGVVLQNFARTSATTGLATLGLSPSVRSGTSVMYTRGPAAKAAASFQVFEPTPPVWLVPRKDPISLVRSSGKVTVHLRAASETWRWSAGETYLPEIMEGVGIEVSAGRVDPNDSRYLVVDFLLDATGPGGWLAVVVPMGDRIGLAHLQVKGDDDNLSATLNPTRLLAGDREAKLQATVPAALDLSDGPAEAIPRSAKVFARTARRLSTSSEIIFDVAVDAPEATVPVYFRGTVGAAVGMLQITRLATATLDGDGPEDWVFLEPQTKLVDVIPSRFPAVIGFDWINGSLNSISSILSDPQWQPLDTLPLDESLLSCALDTHESSYLVQVAEPSGVLRGRAHALSAVLKLDEAKTLLNQDPCLTPFLGQGSLSDAFDTSSLVFGTQTTCVTAVVVSARRIINRPWLMGDLAIDLHGPEGRPILPAISATGWPTPLDPDPTLYCPEIRADEETFRVNSEAVLSAELAAAGEFLVNVRRAFVLRELSRAPGASFIEVEGIPGGPTSGLSLELLDTQTGLPSASFELSDAASSFPESGVLVIAGSPLPEATAVHEVGALPGTGSFAVALLEDGGVIDSVQVGASTGPSQGEGDVVTDELGISVFVRFGRFDTNDNQRDFVPAAVATPGR